MNLTADEVKENLFEKCCFIASYKSKCQLRRDNNRIIDSNEFKVACNQSIIISILLIPHFNLVHIEFQMMNMKSSELVLILSKYEY